MKNHRLIKSLAATALLCLPLIAVTPLVAAPSATSPPTSAANSVNITRADTQIKKAQQAASYSAYDIDGRSSASVLAAKRSHTVSAQDERGLAIFSGIFVICLVIFFAQAFDKKK